MAIKVLFSRKLLLNITIFFVGSFAGNFSGNLAFSADAPSQAEGNNPSSVGAETQYGRLLQSLSTFDSVKTEEVLSSLKAEDIQKMKSLINQGQMLPNKKRALHKLLTANQSRIQCEEGKSRMQSFTQSKSCTPHQPMAQMSHSLGLLHEGCITSPDLDAILRESPQLLFEIFSQGLRAFASLPKGISGSTSQETLSRFFNGLDPQVKSQLEKIAASIGGAKKLRELKEQLLKDLQQAKVPTLSKGGMILGPAARYAGNERARDSQEIDSGYILNPYQMASIQDRIKSEVSENTRALANTLDSSRSDSEKLQGLVKTFPGFYGYRLDRENSEKSNKAVGRRFVDNCAIVLNPEIFSNFVERKSTEFRCDLSSSQKELNSKQIDCLCESARGVLRMSFKNEGSTQTKATTLSSTSRSGQTSSSPQDKKRQAAAVDWLKWVVETARTTPADSKSSNPSTCASQILQKRGLDAQIKNLNEEVQKFCKTLLGSSSEIECAKMLNSLAGCELDSRLFDNIEQYRNDIEKRIRNKFQLVMNLQAIEKNPALLQKFQGVLSKLSAEPEKAGFLSPQQRFYIYLGNLHLLSDNNFEVALSKFDKANPEALRQDILASIGDKKWSDFSCNPEN